MKLTARDILFVCLMAALIGAAHVFMVMPVEAQRRMLLADNRIRQKSLDELSIETTNLGELRGQANVLEHSSSFNSAETIWQTTDQLQAWIAQANLIGIVQFGTVEQKDGYLVQTVSLSLTGPFSGLTQLFQQIEQSHLSYHVKHLSVDHGVAVQLTLQIFYRTK